MVIKTVYETVRVFQTNDNNMMHTCLAVIWDTETFMYASALTIVPNHPSQGYDLSCGNISRIHYAGHSFDIAVEPFYQPMPTTCKTRPAGRVRPATLFCPAREMFLNYNGNRPSACHRPQLHYTIEGLSCLRLHRLKTNVIATFIFVDNALLNARWIVWILISNDIFVDRSFH